MKTVSFFVGVILVLGVNTASALEVDASVNLKNENKGNGTYSLANQGKGSSTVSTSAREIRGWDDADKKEFLSKVKLEAQLKSGQDLENFAKGVMLKDKNVSEVNSGETDVEVHYKLPAKFLGVFESEIDAITNVSFLTNKQGRGPTFVTVKFPWYKRFFSLASSTREEILQTALDKNIQLYAQTPRDNTYAQNGVTVQLISDILKGIRAKIEASATSTKK